MDKKMDKDEKEKKDRKKRGSKGGKAQHEQKNPDEGYIEEIDVDTFENNEEL